MGNIGHKIIANSDYSSLTKPIYPFFKPSVSARQYDPPSQYFSYPYPPPHPMISPPSYNNNYMHQARRNIYNTILKDKVQDLEDALMERQTMKKESTLAKVHSLAQLSTIHEDRDSSSSEMLKIMSKQQDLLGDMVKTVQSLQPRFNFPQHGLEYGYAHPAPQAARTPDSKKPGFNREELLKDLDLEYENEEDYFTEAKKYKYGELSQEERSKVYDQISVEKMKRERSEHKRFIRGKRRFRALVWTILFPVFVFAAMMKRKGTMKKAYIKDMKDSIEIFREVAGTWVLKSARDPIISILSDASLDFNVTAKDQWFSKGKPDALNTKKLKIHVRLRGIFQGLLNNTNKESFPRPLMLFIDRFVNNGAFIPQKYFVPYEKARLEFDEFEGLRNQTEEKKGMLIAFFFITRILVAMFLLNPEKNGLPVRKNSRVLG